MLLSSAVGHNSRDTPLHYPKIEYNVCKLSSRLAFLKYIKFKLLTSENIES